MRKFICFLFVSFVLVSCSSPENKAGRAAIEQMEEVYKLDDVELISSEPQRSRIAFIVSLLDRLFNGRNYEVVLEVNDSIPVQVDGTVNIRRLELEDYNYVQAKHETYEQKQNTYQQIMKELENLGVRDMTVSDDYFDETTRTIYYRLTLTDESIPTDELLQHLDEASNMLLENIDTTIRIGIHVDAQDLLGGNIRNKQIEIRLPAYDKNEEGAFIQLLNEQLEAVQAANRINQELIDELEEYPLSIVSSQMEKVDLSASNRSGETIMYHELAIRTLDGYEKQDLLDTFILLKENDLENSYVQLSIVSQIYEPCQVKEVNTISDLEKCMELPSFESDYR